MRVFENCVIYLASFFPIARKLLNFFSVRHFSRPKILNFLIWDETSKLRQQSVEIVKVGPKRELRRQSVVFGVQRCLIWRSKPCRATFKFTWDKSLEIDIKAFTLKNVLFLIFGEFSRKISPFLGGWVFIVLWPQKLRCGP